MIREMRELQTPQGMGVASVDGGSLFDCRVPGSSLRFGPFSTVQDFHQHLRRVWSLIPGLILKSRTLSNNKANLGLCITHGDLSSLNIFVRGDDIVALLIGNSCCIHHMGIHFCPPSQSQNSFWVNEIDNFLQSMPEELAMERIRQKYFGDI
ncbi:hypothetical protein CISG_09093 [Coccidioides immitis RMSCC 3703]|uniref:Aminoglycoside phosphotransferase domain-containing protein n=1 Tax=Coccidioides immitis RMSCC 3703 TaxID=454286 RepID=A0A0J8R9H4_COCIT|nr:hypothetical protein CISG_09093 [Coccidioides immitis RMSCC 3703]